MKIYFVTTLEDLYDSYSFKRTVGYYCNIEDAKYVVENNVCDINETCYDYAVIEEIEEGMYPRVEQQLFYKFDYFDKKYKETSYNKFPYKGWQAVKIG
jgi:hypothetical protein